MKNLRNIYRILAVVILLMGFSKVAQAQNYAVSTNVMSWAGLGTINAEGSISVHRHITLHCGGTANPWKLTTPTNIEIKNRQYSAYVGMRYWPWHVYSEWWVGAKLQYKNFEKVGILSRDLMKGNAFGPGISAGYTLMLNNNVNLDIGLGLWGGGMKMAGEGIKPFFFIDSLIVAFVYIF